MKNKIYNEPYFDRIGWILENIEKSQLTSIEALVVLQLEHMQKNKIPVDLDVLARRCKVDVELIDLILESLRAKDYLRIEVQTSTIVYDLEGLFDHPETLATTDEEVFRIFEQEFGRPLSSTEIDKLIDWLKNAGTQFCIHALREAVMYRKLSFGYIDKVLSQWLKSGVTLEQLNEGRRNDDAND